jgi:hypothetical protein
MNSSKILNRAWIRRAGMWTKKISRYERRRLRNESDLSYQKYALIEPFLPPERSISGRSVVNGTYSTYLPRGANGGTFRPKARHMTTLSGRIKPMRSRGCWNWKARTRQRIDGRVSLSFLAPRSPEQISRSHPATCRTATCLCRCWPLRASGSSRLRRSP